MRTALTAALRDRDMIAVAALRSALSAIANAEAVPPPGVAPPPGESGPHFAGARLGLGAGEAARRDLTEAQARDILLTEVSDRQLTARVYETSGHSQRAQRLRGEAEVLLRVLDGENS